MKVNLKNLILAINKNDLGIGEFLTKCKVAPATYLAIRKGNNKIKLQTVNKIAKFLKVDIETLIEEY